MKAPFTVPSGMSCVNVLYALWQEVPRGCYLFDYHPSLDAAEFKMMDTLEKVTRLFRERTYFDRVGGKFLRVDFTKFPDIHVEEYNKLYGSGAAETAIKEYAKIYSPNRFDRYDLYSFRELTESIKGPTQSELVFLFAEADRQYCEAHPHLNPPTLRRSLPAPPGLRRSRRPEYKKQEGKRFLKSISAE